MSDGNMNWLGLMVIIIMRHLTGKQMNSSFSSFFSSSFSFFLFLFLLSCTIRELCSDIVLYKYNGSVTTE